MLDCDANFASKRKNNNIIRYNILRFHEKSRFDIFEYTEIFRTDVNFFNDNSIKCTNIPKNIPT